MNLDEYNKVKDMTYNEYCDYLQAKYGIGLSDYFYPNSMTKNPNCRRTNEGLFCHHRAENMHILLSRTCVAKRLPWEYQKKENLLYCDFLEHLFLHVLICEYPGKEEFAKLMQKHPTNNGVDVFMLPELNSWYDGTVELLPWQQICFGKIEEDKIVFKLLVSRWNADKKRLSSDNPCAFAVMDINSEYCSCVGNVTYSVGFEDEWGYWDVCSECGKRIEGGYHSYDDDPDENWSDEC